MTTEVLQQTLQAGAPGYFGQGRIFYIKTSANGGLTIRARKSGQGSTNVRSFLNIAAGMKFKADVGDGWDILEVTSATTQLVELIVGDDDVEVSSAVTVNGSVTVADILPTSFTNTAPVVLAPAVAIQLIAANIARKKVTFFADPAAADPVFFRGLIGGNNLGFVQGGMGYGFANTGAIFGICASATTIYVMEEF